MQRTVPRTTPVKPLRPTPAGFTGCFSLAGALFIACSAGAADPPGRPRQAPAEESSALPAAADLRPVFDKLGLERRKQGARGTCSVFTVVAALEFALGREPKAERLSVEFLNWAANQAGGSANDGGFFSEMWEGFEAYGICTEDEMPYRAGFQPADTPSPQVLLSAKARLQRGLSRHWIKRWDVTTGLAASHLLDIRRTLSQGWPVCAGLRWPKRESWQGDVLQMCGPEAVFDGHSVLLVGYKGDESQPGAGVFIFRNTSNGGRDGLMPYAFASAYINDAMWIEATRDKTRAPKR